MTRISTVSPQQLRRFAAAIDEAGDADHITKSFYLGARLVVGVVDDP